MSNRPRFVSALMVQVGAIGGRAKLQEGLTPYGNAYIDAADRLDHGLAQQAKALGLGP